MDWTARFCARTGASLAIPSWPQWPHSRQPQIAARRREGGEKNAKRASSHLFCRDFQRRLLYAPASEAVRNPFRPVSTKAHTAIPCSNPLGLPISRQSSGTPDGTPSGPRKSGMCLVLFSAQPLPQPFQRHNQPFSARKDPGVFPPCPAPVAGPARYLRETRAFPGKTADVPPIVPCFLSIPKRCSRQPQTICFRSDWMDPILHLVFPSPSVFPFQPFERRFQQTPRSGPGHVPDSRFDPCISPAPCLTRGTPRRRRKNKRNPLNPIP